LAASVDFAGWLSQAGCADRLRGADCLVLPSIYECGGAVVLEAMSVGKPVIATDWGGPADYLDPECGILVPPTSRQAFVEGLRDAMVRMARSPQDRERLGAHGIAKVRREYDWDVKVDGMLGFYELAARGGKAR
jgi:glycosyltransferase involved in cell wall biosynthesis